MCDIKTPLPLKADLSLSCSWYLDFPTRQDEQIFFQPAQAISHTPYSENTCWFLTDFLLKRSVSLLPLCFNLFICVPLPVCQRGVNSPWATKVLGQIESLPSAWYNQGKKHEKAWQNRAGSLAESEEMKAPLTFILSPFFCRGSVLGIKITLHARQVRVQIINAPKVVTHHQQLTGNAPRCYFLYVPSPTGPKNHKSKELDLMILVNPFQLDLFCREDVTSSSVTGVHHCVTLTWPIHTSSTVASLRNHRCSLAEGWHGVAKAQKAKLSALFCCVPFQRQALLSWWCVLWKGTPAHHQQRLHRVIGQIQVCAGHPLGKKHFSLSQSLLFQY